jgi:hypothetical protein
MAGEIFRMVTRIERQHSAFLVARLILSTGLALRSFTEESPDDPRTLAQLEAGLRAFLSPAQINALKTPEEVPAPRPFPTPAAFRAFSLPSPSEGSEMVTVSAPAFRPSAPSAPGPRGRIYRIVSFLEQRRSAFLIARLVLLSKVQVRSFGPQSPDDAEALRRVESTLTSLLSAHELHELSVWLAQPHGAPSQETSASFSRLSPPSEEP